MDAGEALLEIVAQLEHGVLVGRLASLRLSGDADGSDETLDGTVVVERDGSCGRSRGGLRFEEHGTDHYDDGDNDNCKDNKAAKSFEHRQGS
ncbi:MAG: hypothetical protein WDN23_12055 [Edaphobacter sp.]